MSSVSELLGKTLISVEQRGDEEIVFVVDDGTTYRMHHRQACCESVTIEDVCGDLADLVGLPLTMAEETVSPEGKPAPEYPVSWTWTFYRFATARGYVTIRWLGESNGCYGEQVDFCRVAA